MILSEQVDRHANKLKVCDQVDRQSLKNTQYLKPGRAAAE